MGLLLAFDAVVLQRSEGCMTNDWIRYLACNCGTEPCSAQVPPTALLALVPSATPVVLPFKGMDYSFQVNPTRGWLLSEELPAQRAFTLPPQETSVVTPPLGIGQKQLARNLCVMSQGGA